MEFRGERGEADNKLSTARRENLLQNGAGARHAILGADQFAEALGAGRGVASQQSLERRPDVPRVVLMRQDNFGDAERFESPRVVRLIEGEGARH